MKHTMKTKGYRALAVSLLIIGLALSGCAMKQDVIRVEEKVNQVRIDQKLLNAKLNNVDSLMTAGAAEDNRLRADMRSSIEDLNAQLTQLQNQITDLNQMIYGMMQRAQSGQANSPQVVKQPETTASNQTGAADTTTQSSVDCHNLWDTAFKDMNRGQYDLALSGFSDYLKYCPNGPLADNSQYWVAECYYEMELLEQAIGEYNKLMEKYPESEKKASAIFKIGRSYEKLNKNDEALKYYLRLQNEYPESLQYNQVKDKISEWQNAKKN